MHRTKLKTLAETLNPCQYHVRNRQLLVLSYEPGDPKGASDGVMAEPKLKTKPKEDESERYLKVLHVLECGSTVCV